MSTQEIGKRLLLLGRRPLRRPLLRAPVLLCPRCMRQQGLTTTTTTTTTGQPPTAPKTPFRKQIKDEAKARKKRAAAAAEPVANDWRRAQAVPGWELTVGIEIHAQLNTARKLFSGASSAAATSNSLPNTHVAYFDFALPGAQPQFQAGVLVPAVRAALALGCAVQPVSRFDRKHYFHWDQPAGYQITQYYEALARGGRVVLFARDGIAGEDAEGLGASDGLAIDIVQVQMEQDTAKTLAQPGRSGPGGSDAVHWLDFNRVGVPLIEIITAPQIRHPATAAALVRKVQQLLRAVDACAAGMEAGGLRADVNVSVRRVGDRNLGTRTEIKNLNSFRAVEDAVIAERNRQIAVLEAGGAVVGETRGWTPGSGATHRLRGKEGEVDYRYMPDPDLAPVRIDPALTAYLQQTMGVLPDAEVDDLVAHYGLTTKDAMALMQLDDGGRAQFYYDVVAAFEARLGVKEGGAATTAATEATAEEQAAYRSFIANWVLHQLGRLTSERNGGAESASSSSSASSTNDLEMTPDGRCRIPVACLADLLVYRYQGRITAGVAKELLFAIFRGDVGDGSGSGSTATPVFASVTEAIDKGGLWFQEIDAAAYAALAREALDGEAKTLRLFVDHAVAMGPGSGGGGTPPVSAKAKKYPHGKLQYLTGKLMRLGPEGRTDPLAAEAAVQAAVDEHVTGVLAAKKAAEGKT